MVPKGEAGGACHLFARGTAPDSGDDRGLQARRGPRSQYLSSFVPVYLMGVEEAEGSRRLSPERLQGAVPHCSTLAACRRKKSWTTCCTRCRACPIFVW